MSHLRDGEQFIANLANQPENRTGTTANFYSQAIESPTLHSTHTFLGVEAFVQGPSQDKL